jgi:hypothetical protein
MLTYDKPIISTERFTHLKKWVSKFLFLEISIYYKMIEKRGRNNVPLSFCWFRVLLG